MFMDYPLLLYRGEHFNANFFQLSNVDIDHSFIIAYGSEQTLLVPRMNFRAAKEQFSGTILPYKDPLLELKKLLKRKKVSVDGASIGFGFSERLKKFCSPQDVSDQLMRRRMIKEKDQVARIKKATEATKEIFASLDIRKGKTEADIKKQLLVATMDMGLDSAFKPIVAADRNSSFPHYKTGTAKINEMVLIDYGIRYENFSSDLTRCFFVNGSKQKKVYEKLQGVLAELIEKIPRLKTGGKLARYSAELFKKKGLPELPHAIGHGIGLEVHEFPRISPKSKDKLAGTTLAIEPSAYYEEFGVRFEETIYFDGKKAIIL